MIPLNHKINKISLPLSVVLSIGFLIVGFLLGAGLTHKNPVASAQNTCPINEGQLTKIYNAVFHRPLDAGAHGYINHDLGLVLDEISKSQEHIMYSGLFTAAKALENARREPGNKTTIEKTDY